MKKLKFLLFLLSWAITSSIATNTLPAAGPPSALALTMPSQMAVSDSIHAAAARGSIQDVTKALEGGASIDSRDTKGWTPLMHAIKNVQTEMVEFLSSKGADVNAGEALIGNGLHLAAMEGRTEIVRLLLDKGADPNRRGSSGSPLRLAVGRNQRSVAELLLARGADVNAADSYYKITPLYEASTTGNREMVELLLGSGANVDVRDRLGNTPLLGALQKQGCDSPIPETLIRKGASLDIRGFQGETPLMVASGNGCIALATLLIDRGADMDAEVETGARRGQTALILSILEKRGDIARLLLQKGANADRGAFRGMTAVVWAIEMNDAATVETLLDKGILKNREVEYNEGKIVFDQWLYVFFWAAEKGSLAATQKLLDKGINVNEKAKNGSTALMIAARANQKDVVVLLLKKGADPTATDASGKTALEYAADPATRALLSQSR